MNADDQNWVNVSIEREIAVSVRLTLLENAMRCVGDDTYNQNVQITPDNRRKRIREYYEFFLEITKIQ